MGWLSRTTRGGIETDRLAQAFHPFNTTKPQGMGLGLAICQRLTRYAGGDIALRNHPAPNGKTGLRVALDFSNHQNKDA
ncbi:putative sensor protein [Atlantibacter hermannii]|nr:putative sensor protein [Atlantibacter hermannii]